MTDFSELKQRVYNANMELVNNNLVIYTFGNVSGIDRDKGIIAIKPSGVPYRELSPEKIVLVDMDCTVVEGNLKPSTDTKTHIVLYKHFSSLGGVAHTHSTYATAWAQAVMPIPCLGTTHADHAYGEIPVTEPLSEDMIKHDYETATGLQIIRRMENIELPPSMVLVSQHGPFTWGDTPEQAVYNSVILEEIAETAYIAKAINPEIGPIRKELMDKHYMRKHGKDSYYGQSSSDQSR